MLSGGTTAWPRASAALSSLQREIFAMKGEAGEPRAGSPDINPQEGLFWELLLSKRPCRCSWGASGVGLCSCFWRDSPGTSTGCALVCTREGPWRTPLG